MNDKKLVPPAGKIVPTEELNKKYYIDEIFVDEKDREAVSERIQMIDWFDYMLDNSRAEYPGCDKLLQEYAIINVMSVIEAFMQESIHRCFLYCRNRSEHEDCKECRSCRYFFTEGKDYELRFRKTLDVFLAQGLLNKDDCEILKRCYETRNEVHIRQLFGRKLEEKIYRVHYDSAISYIDKIAVKCLEEMTPYYDRCRGYKEDISTAEEMISGSPGSEKSPLPELDKSEQAIMDILNIFKPIAYIDEETVHKNFLLCCRAGVEDRTISKPLADFLFQNASLIALGLLVNESFRETLLSAVYIEKALEEENEEKEIIIREEMKCDASSEFKKEFYRFDLETQVIDVNEYNEGIYESVSQRIAQSFDRTPHYGDSSIEWETIISAQTDNISERVFIMNGDILGNWMYLFRAFARNPFFTEYIEFMVMAMSNVLSGKSIFENIRSPRFVEHFNTKWDKYEETLFPELCRTYRKDDHNIERIRQTITEILSIFKPIAFFSETNMERNLWLACGGMSVEDRTITKALEDFLLKHTWDLIVAVLVNGNFRKRMATAVSTEMNMEQMSAEAVDRKREKMESVPHDIFEKFYSEKLETHVIDLTNFNEEIYKTLYDQIFMADEDGFGFSELVNEMSEDISESAYAEYSVIFNNWMYLIRAFIKNPSFTAYVDGYLEDIQKMMS